MHLSSARSFLLVVLLGTISPFVSAQEPGDETQTEKLEGDSGNNDIIPTMTFTKFPPGPPTSISEPQKLDPGERYADPRNNPFRRESNIIRGTKTTATFIPFKTELPNDEDEPEGCDPPATNYKNLTLKHWAHSFGEVISRDGVVQPRGFGLDMWQALDFEEFKGQAGGELTLPGQVVYGPIRKTEPVSKEKRLIFGPDDRVRVQNTWIFPFSTVGEVGGGCTGTLIGPRHVLTAAHCVHSGGKNGNWYKDLDFTLWRTPGTRGNQFNQVTYKWSQAFTVTGWTKHRNFDYDYALIVLETRNTFQGWMSFGYNNALSTRYRLNLNGFPGDKPDRTMWHSFGPVTDVARLHFDHKIDLLPGQSGSGVYHYNGVKRVILGVHSHHQTICYPNFPDFWNCHKVSSNTATRINQQRFKQICGWMNSHLC